MKEHCSAPIESGNMLQTGFMLNSKKEKSILIQSGTKYYPKQNLSFRPKSSTVNLLSKLLGSFCTSFHCVENRLGKAVLPELVERSDRCAAL